MDGKSEVKPESLLNLDDLLQCPVCYEIPPGQIFQCNEGHHVCGGCKMRLDVCPVCRALFFGTRNYAMEELISNFRKMRSLKLSSKASGSGSSQSSTPAKDNTSEERENNASENEDDDGHNTVNALELNPPSARPPQACSGLFRCLCCKAGSTARLPAARLLNHLRYFHSRDLIEGRSENGEYLQAWQFETVPGKLVIAVRIADMGIFFLTIDISTASLCAWLSMAATPWIAHEFSYTITICGNDREAIFSDSVWSVRSCEGTLKKRGHCLMVRDADALALTAPAAINGKLSVRRTPPDQLTAQTTPRAVLRIASRGTQHAITEHVNEHAVNEHAVNEHDPYLRELQNDVRRLSRVFAGLSRDANAILALENEADRRARVEQIEQEAAEPFNGPFDDDAHTSDSDVEMPEPRPEPRPEGAELTRNARKRLKQRMRALLEHPIPPLPATASNVHNRPAQSRQNGPVSHPRQSNPTTAAVPSQTVTQPTQGTSNAQRQNSSAAQSRQNASQTTRTRGYGRQRTPAAQLEASLAQPTQTTTQPTQTTAQHRQNNAAQPTQRNVNQQRAENVHPRQNTFNAPLPNDVHNNSSYVAYDELFNNYVREPSPPVPPPAAASFSAARAQPQTSNGGRNKKKRRHRK